MKKRKLIILTVLIGVVLIVIIGAIVAKSRIEASLEQLKNMPVEDVDLSKIPDGTFAGTYEVFPVAADVEVTVKDHKILSIELVRHENGKGAAAESIPQKIVDTQTLKVDTVSGATYSSKVILKAIENALKNAVGG